MTRDMMQEIERYLCQATLLLPATAAKRVRAELHSHLYQEALDAQLAGLSERAAWRQVLREAGPAWLTALRFARVYSLGTLLRLTLVGAALGGAAYAVQTRSVPVSIHQQAQP